MRVVLWRRLFCLSKGGSVTERLRRPLVLLVACLVLFPLLPSAGAVSPGSVPQLGMDKLLPAIRAAEQRIESLQPKVSGVRVALISSGVEPRVFPDDVAKRIAGARSDTVGLGTFAASHLFQLGHELSVTSLNVYNGKDLHAGALENALSWVAANASKLDAVLLAFPPHAALDPASAAMAAGTWHLVLDAMGEEPVATKEGVVFGLPIEGAALNAKLASLPAALRAAAASYLEDARRWQRMRASIAKLNAEGVSIVVPAGDLGPDLQTITGIAGLPEVITVGGMDGSAPSATSGSGPSIEGSVKPDLLAPTGIAGLLPDKSILADELEKIIDPSLELRELGGAPKTDLRARVDTTIASASAVAATVGALAREGLRNAGRQRGALMAASVPIDGVPVWRQGAGALRGVPDESFATSRPLALGNANLGAEPEAGPWASSVGFRNGRPASAAATLRDFAGVDPTGRTMQRTADAPPLRATVTEEGVSISAPVGDDRFQGGVFCGYTEVAVPTTGASARPSVQIDGVPADTEHVPTCLVKGSRVRAFGFYIHDLPAENLTFSLLPALPPEASVVHKPLTILPIDPLATRLYTRVTDEAGYAYFTNVVPGYYTVRQFSDYGAPTTQRVTDPVSKTLKTLNVDVGENPSYQDFDALFLGATGWTEDDLRARFGDENVTPDKPTATNWVTIAGRRTRVVLDSFKKMPGTAVSSRYIDLLSAKDLDFRAVALADALGLGEVAKALPQTSSARGWTYVERGEGVTGVFNPLLAAAAEGQILGVGTYPFNLTTPNYKGHMSLNFSYEVRNAAILAVVKMGDEVAAGVVTPQGTIQTPSLGVAPLGGVPVVGHADGLANFEFHMTPGGVSEGTLFLIFLPSRPVQQLASPLTTATVDDLSFELDTWQRINWPASFNAGHGMGHVFSVNPNYSARQMSHAGCRPIASGSSSADVCEDWRVFVHSPGDDAATVDVEAMVGGAQRSIAHAVRSTGGVYADPRRGTTDFSSGFVFRLPTAGGPAEASFRVDNPFRTNGRFWEQLVLGRDVLDRYRGRLVVEIVDNQRGRSSPLLRHRRGGAPVDPYVAFVPRADVVGGPAKLGVPIPN